MKMNRRQYLVATAGTLLCTGCLSNTQLPDYDTAPGSFRPLGDAIWEYELPNTLGPVTVGEDPYVATQSELIRISASGTIQWATEFPSGLSNYPRKFDLTVCEDAIYAWLPSASRTNDVTAFNASSGKQQWTQTIDHNDRQFIGTTDGAVYMSSTPSEEGAVTGEVIALEDDTGDKRWQQEKGSDLGSVASHELCIVSSPVDGLTAFDTGTGEVQWDKEISGDRGARLLVIDDILCVGRENTVTGYSLPEGTELWQSGAGGQIEPTVSGDTNHPHLYILEKDEDLTALNPTTGETRWKVDRDWNRIGSSGIVLSQNSVLYYSEVGLTNHDASTGEQRWGYTLDSDSSFRGPFIVDGVVFIVTHRGSENPVVRGFDAETGRRQWRTRLESTTELPFVGGIFDEYAVLMTDTYLYGMRVRSR